MVEPSAARAPRTTILVAVTFLTFMGCLFSCPYRLVGADRMGTAEAKELYKDRAASADA